METPINLAYSKALESRIRTLKEKDKLTPRNKELVLKFVEHALTNGVGDRRITKYFGQLKHIDKWLGKDFDKATKEDIERIVRIIATSNYKEWTKWSLRVMIKTFWKWLEGNNEFYPDKVKWIKAKQVPGKITPPEDLITRNDLRKIIVSCTSDRDRCFTALLYESGARIGEILGLRIKDIDFQTDLVRILLDAKKTKTKRRIPIVESVPYIMRWLQSHPNKEPESFLFVNYGKYTGCRMTRDCVYALMKRLTLKLNNGKKLYPHLFRHSRATELANHLTEAQMNKFFGWTAGSDMPSVYVHLSGRDIDDAILTIYGKEREKKKTYKTLTPKPCPRCKEDCLPTDSLCLNCGLPLTPEAMVKYKERKDGISNTIERIIEMKLRARLEEAGITGKN